MSDLCYCVAPLEPGCRHCWRARIRELEDGIRHQGHSERCGWNMMNPCTCLMSLLPEEDDRE